MADNSDSKLGGLPGLDYGPVTLQPAPVVSFDNVAQAFGNLAKEAGDIADNYFSQQAQQEGQQAVSRDENGNLTEASPSLLTRITGQTAAFQQAAKARWVSETAVDTGAKVAAAKEQYAGNPDGFRGWLDNYTASVLNNTPQPFVATSRAMIDQAGGAALAQITAAKTHDDLKSSAEAQFTAWDQYYAQAIALAKGGQYGSPQFNTVQQKMQDIQDSVNINPATAQFVTPERQAKFNSATTEPKGWAIGAHVLAQYDQDHDEGKAIASLDQIVTNPSLGIQPTQAEAIRSRVSGEIRARHAAETNGAAEQQRQVFYLKDDAKKAAMDGGTDARNAILPDAAIYAAYPKNRAYANQIIEELNQASAVHDATRDLATMGAKDRQAYLAKLNPANAASTATSGFDAAWQFTLQHEGGYAAHDANGAPVNFGINQAAHPGVDVKNLTPDQAKQIAKSDYWDKIGGDSLSPAMQAAAFDTAYIFGPAAAQKMVDQANGDPQALINIRAQHMQDLIDKDPAKFGKYENAWEARNNDLRALAANGGGAPGYAARHNVYEAAVAANKKIESALADDPAAYVAGARPELGAQLQSGDPAQRAAGVRALLQNETDMGVPPARQTVFSKPQAQALHDSLTLGSPQQAVAALHGAAAGLSDTQLRIAARQITPKNTAFGQALAVAKSDPVLAQNIVIGERYRLENPGVIPKANTLNTDFDSYTGNLFALAPDARSRTMATAAALYAGAKIGKASDYDQDAYDKAVAAAVGGIFTFRGGQTIPPPRPGMDENATEDMVRGLTENDILRYGNNLPVYANGQPASAADIAQYGVLTWTGTPGVYRVSMPGQGTLGVRSGGSFMLWLGGKATGDMGNPLFATKAHH